MRPVNLNRNFVILDFETTGLSPTNSRPIEIGLLLLDSDFKKTGEYSSYITWNSFRTRDQKEWNKKEVGAYDVHKIPFNKILTKGIAPYDVVKKVADVGKGLIKNELKPILISDNAMFDGSFLDDLFYTFDEDYRNYFHYSIWDTSLLFSLVKRNNQELYPNIEAVHNSLGDCEITHGMLLEALEVLK